MNRTFRKRLDDDCLLEGQLHPSVVERLARVREVPVIAVANLHGVERDAQGVWLVWQYIPGVNLEEYLSSPRPEAERDDISRQLRLVVAALHSHGIVHGALHARNVIVDPNGQVHLTHISPLLFSDTQRDMGAVDALLEKMGTLRTLSPASAQDGRSSRRVRVTAYLSAASAVVAGMVIFWAILWYIRD